MTDIAAQIRQLIAQTQSPVAILETPDTLTEAEYADLVARFRAAQLRPHEEIKVVPRALTDRVADALLAVLELHQPTYFGYADGDRYHGQTPDCGACEDRAGLLSWPCRTVLAVAEALGIEVEA